MDRQLVSADEPSALACANGHSLLADGAGLRPSLARDHHQSALGLDLAPTRRTLFEALLDARDRFGKNKVALEDPDRQPLTYGRLVLAALVLGDKLSAITARREAVGVFLPNVQGVMATLLGISATGRVPAMLNFTAGLRNLASAVQIAHITTIVTSRRFIDTAKLDEIVAGLEGSEIRLPDGTTKPLRFIYLEDVRKTVGTLDKARAAARAVRARSFARGYGVTPDDPGVILFTSGSEGLPKGVVLSHANLLANAYQIFTHDGGGILRPDDVIFNPLPVFHSYGLTAGTLLGIFNGMKVVLYPSPLHYRQIPKLIKDVDAHILFGTDTFLRAWAKAADPGDLQKVRIVVAGAERVKDDTRATWQAFGTTIIEGYGATECSPVIACNSPRDNQPGTVGQLLPGITVKLEPVEGIHEGGRLLVKGPNVMRGYMLAGEPGRIVPPRDGWHDTGDIVSIDPAGHLTIRGRAKRFAKIGGEMVSMAAVETMVSELWDGVNHVVVALADARKGEQLVLLTEKPDADRDQLLAHARAQGFPELWVPRSVLVVPMIPVLGSGKVDFVALQELAKQMRPFL